jgi:phosphoglycolate phosphatase-like HAD superfamily hydrolase
MVLRAASEHGLDLPASWFIGDILDDVEAGTRAGCRTVLIDNGNETLWEPGPARIPTLREPDLLRAALAIVREQDASLNVKERTAETITTTLAARHSTA